VVEWIDTTVQYTRRGKEKSWKGTRNKELTKTENKWLVRERSKDKTTNGRVDMQNTCRQAVVRN
jgi:hypothetical protein